VINLLAYVRKDQKEERGKEVEFTDLAEFGDIDSKISEFDPEDTTLFKQSLEYYNLIKNSNP
jgi:hypothetical protein